MSSGYWLGVRRWITGVAWIAVAGLIVGYVGMVPPASAAGAQPEAGRAGSAAVVSSCTQAALRAAVASGGTVTFTCSGTITVTSQLVVAAGQDVTVSGVGQSITISGGGTSRIFDVTGGSLALTDLTLTDGLAAGGSGTDGKDGADGADGEAGNGGRGGSPAGQSGTSGTDGGAGSAGTAGHTGGDGEGGAVFIAAGATVSLTSVTVSASAAQGGDGGQGGTGGDGGSAGGAGGGGQGGGTPAAARTARLAADGGTGTGCDANATIPGGQGGWVNDPVQFSDGGVGGGHPFVVAKGAPGTGGNGGDGGSAGAGGNAGTGGAGGTGNGGGIYNAGTLTVTSSTFADDTATGGTGGQGGDGGTAGWSGGGGGGGDTIVCGTPSDLIGAAAGHGGRAGDGAASGNAGDGGDGGAGNGGAIDSDGTVAITGSSFFGDSANGGAGGATGEPAFARGAQGGGSGGVGSPQGRSGAAGMAGTPGAAGTAGAGGDAAGGAVAGGGAIAVTGSNFDAWAIGGRGGGSGSGFEAGNGFNGMGAAIGTTCFGAWPASAVCGTAAPAGGGGAGDDGGAGGAGGASDGGAIAATGPSLTVGSTTFDGCSADGGSGGYGGGGGLGGTGGAGGAGGNSSSTPSGGAGGQGGDGGDGGSGGDGGPGGGAHGGALYASGLSPVISDDSFTGCGVTGGSGAAGGGADDGGNGGAGGSGGGGSATGAGGTGGDGGNGGSGGHGGAGGDGTGGAIFTDEMLMVGCQVSYSGDTVTAGSGGNAGSGGTSGNGGGAGSGDPAGSDGKDGADGTGGVAGQDAVAADPDVAGAQQAATCCPPAPDRQDAKSTSDCGPKAELTAVRFAPAAAAAPGTPGLPVIKDDGKAPVTDHQSGPATCPDGLASPKSYDYLDCALPPTGVPSKDWPVIFTAGSAVTVSQVVFVSADLLTSPQLTATVQDGDGSVIMTLPPTALTLAQVGQGYELSAQNLTFDAALHPVPGRDVLTISWTITSGGDSISAGVSHHVVYVTAAPYAAPAGTPAEPPYLSLLDVGTAAAAGQPGPRSVFNAIWATFETRTIAHPILHTATGDVSYGKDFRYYHNGYTTIGAWWNKRIIGPCPDLANMLTTTEGRCGNWADFLANVLAYQGIDASVVNLGHDPDFYPGPEPSPAKNPVHYAYMLIGPSLWSAHHPGGPASYPYLDKITVSDSQVTVKKQAVSYTPSGTPIAQGGIKTPPLMFVTGDHAIVSTPWGYVDPSYGLPRSVHPFPNIATYEKAAIAGFAVVYLQAHGHLVPVPLGLQVASVCAHQRCYFAAVPYSQSGVPG